MAKSVLSFEFLVGTEAALPFQLKIKNSKLKIIAHADYSAL